MQSPARMFDAPNALRHHAVVGSSAAALRDFYEYFGFSHLVSEEVPDTTYIRALSGGAWSAARILKVGNDTGDVLEIIEPTGLSEATDTNSVTNWAHIAVTVANCDQAATWAASVGGGSHVGGPVTNPDAPYRVAYVRDPAGNLIEIVERLSTL